MSSIHQVCERMLAEGFEYGSMVSTLTITQYDSTPESMGRPWLKPRVPTLSCSRIFSYEGSEPTLDWHSFVVDQEYMVDAYSKSHLLFVKVDKSRITFESDPCFSKDGLWRKETEDFPLVHWSRVASQYAGITVNPGAKGCRDLFSLWDVDSLAIWDYTCVTDMRAFENAGSDWTYRKCRK